MRLISNETICISNSNPGKIMQEFCETLVQKIYINNLCICFSNSLHMCCNSYSQHGLKKYLASFK